ncbi:MAG: hypothetical protein AB7P04_05555 [Bacteriovoracia bacterium]
MKVGARAICRRGLPVWVLSLLIVLGVLSAPAFGATCEEGFRSFQSTLYKKIRKDCAKCHDGSRPNAPAFAVSDVEASYDTVVNYMNFSQIPESLLVIRAGNGHCNLETCEGESGKEAEAASAAWWDGGEKSCMRNGRMFTAPLAVPVNLPKPDAGFATLSFPLKDVDASFGGALFQVDIQDFVDAATGVKGAYRLRAPRIVNGVAPIYVENIKILLNGKYDSIENAYAGVAKNINFWPVAGDRSITTASPVLSGATLILMKDGLANPKLTVSFVRAEAGAAMACMNLDKFTAKMQPVLNSAKCVNCHKDGSAAKGTQVFSLNKGTEDLCRVATQLFTDNLPMSSAWVAYPTRGLFGHPKLTEAESLSYIEAVKAWKSK